MTIPHFVHQKVIGVGLFSGFAPHFELSPADVIAFLTRTVVGSVKQLIIPNPTGEGRYWFFALPAVFRLASPVVLVEGDEVALLEQNIDLVLGGITIPYVAYVSAYPTHIASITVRIP